MMYRRNFVTSYFSCHAYNVASYFSCHYMNYSSYNGMKNMTQQSSFYTSYVTLLEAKTKFSLLSLVKVKFCYAEHNKIIKFEEFNARKRKKTRSVFNYLAEGEIIFR